MIFGRLILIATTYYNKVIDNDGFSYFVSLNNVRPRFIKVAIDSLDRKVFIYTSSIIVSTDSNLEKMLPIEEVLRYSPFVKGSESKRKNYYREKHPIKKTEIESKPITLNFI